MVAVYTRPDAPSGRGRKLLPSPVKQLAQEHHIPVFTPRSFKDSEAVAQLRDLDAQAAVVVAYGVLLPEEVLDIPEFGWFNLHFSLLPRWRGAAPVQRALEAGDEETGVTIFKIAPGLDTGDILTFQKSDIQPNETAGELLNRLTKQSLPLLDDALEDLAKGTAVLRAQPQQGACYARRLAPDEGQIDWQQPAPKIADKVRAFTPSPGCWTTLPDGMRLKIRGFKVVPDVTLKPAELRIEKKRVLVGTSTEAGQIEEVSVPGKKWMKAADWGRGARLEPGAFLKWQGEGSQNG